MITHGFDPSRVNWFNVLPPLAHKKILCYGPVDQNTLEALVYSRCTCDVIAPELRRHSASPSPEIQYIREHEPLPVGEYDLCIVNTRGFLSGFSRRKMQKIREIHGALKGEGLLLVGADAKIFERLGVMLIERVLNKKGVGKAKRYICNPSFEIPLTVYPVVGNRKVRKNIYEKVHGRRQLNRGLIARCKDSIKYSVSMLLGKHNPFCGIMYLFGKSWGKSDATTALDSVDIDMKSSSFVNHLLCQRWMSLWLSTPFSQRHIGLAYRENGKELVCVSKKTNFSQTGDSAIQDEYKNLIELNRHKAFFLRHNLVFPKPILSRSENNRSLTVETAMAGISLAEMNINDKGQYQGYLECLKNLVSIHGRLQTHMSDQPKGEMKVLPELYFQNPLNLDFEWFGDTGRIQKYRLFFQHGDYVDRNIFYQRATGTYGIIDWEWSGFGFPILYDLFYLFLSACYRKKRRREKSYLDHCYRSFIETFFDESPYGYRIQEMLDEYCRAMAIDKGSVYGYFCDCLLVSYNKYRLNYNFPHYVNFQEKRLLYALENEDKFIVR